MYVPLFLEDGKQGTINPKSFDGFILGVFRTQSLFDTLLPQHIAPGYAIAIFDGSEEIYRRDRSKSDRQLERKWSREANVHFEGVTWRLRVYPTSTLLAEERSLLPAVVLGGGLVIGVLLAGAVRFAQKAQGYARSIKAINQQLTRERAKIQEATMLQRAILDSANYTIISTTVDGTITTFNTAAERWLGYTAAEVVGKTTPVIIHDEDEVRQRAQELSQELGVAIEPGFEAFVAKARREEPDEREWTYIRKDGSRFPVLLSVTALYDAQGNVTGFLGIGSDISDRKRAEKELARLLEREQAARADAEAARSQVTNILESIGDAFFTLDKEWRFTYINRQAELRLQRKREELLGKNVWNEFPEAVGSTFDREYHKAVSERVNVEFEEFYPPLATWFEVHAYPSKEGLSVYFQDISDRKHREEILRNITLGVSAETGEAFFQSLVQYLTKALGVEYAFVGELVEPEGDRIRIIAGCGNGQILDNFEYVLANTPCAQVVGQQPRVYPRDVGQQFPLDAYLAAIEAQSYLGAPLFDSTGHPLGLIAVLSRKPLEDTRLMEEVLTIFAVRASSEIERRRSEAELQRRHLRSQLFAELTLKIRRSLKLETILQTTVTEVQGFLEADRVLLFEIHADGSGTVVQESVVPGFPVTLGQNIVDPCFQEGYLERYRQGRVSAIDDIERADIQPCHVEFLQQFGVKANLVVPILQKEELWGLLIAHQCASPRQWSSFETELLRQLADQIGIALAQAQLLEREIRQRQEIARSQEELLVVTNALESAVEGISRLDVQGRYIYVNQAYASMVGYAPEELIGMDWQAIVHPEDREKMRAAYQKLLANGKAEMEVRALRKDGSVFDKQVVMVKVSDKQQFVGHYCFMKDISDRREIERLKDEFVSIVSHELRTPLTSILGALDLLASGVLSSQPERSQHMLNIAAKNADRLVRLINDILDIERIESGKATITKQACDAANLMTASVEVMQSMAVAAGVTLSVSPLSVRLWADPDRIVQVFTNLLSNAIKFSPPGSTVWLTAEVREKEPSYILFRVRDQGRGIPPDKIETIFGRFQQVDASDSRQKGGTGLGLAVCRSIVQHHGGQIWAESLLGEGSTFSFTLPLAQEEEIKASTHPSGPLVLVCDDDASVRSVVRMVLEHQDYQVITAASGQEAVKLAAQEQPDVILLNLMMPGMNGWETLATLKERAQTKNIPVIILSGLFPDARKATPEVSDWIVKPPDERSLLQALERILTDPNRKVKVLIVEDDADLAQILIAMFDRHGIETYHAQTGREAIQLSQQIFPDLLVLDLILPECDGFAVVDWLRQHNRLCQVPLVVYTSKDLDDSERERLKLGQTLFLTKGRITPEQFEQRVIKLLGRIIRYRKGDDNRDSQTHSDR